MTWLIGSNWVESETLLVPLFQVTTTWHEHLRWLP